jgi:hypothetical protein
LFITNKKTAITKEHAVDGTNSIKMAKSTPNHISAKRYATSKDAKQ